jgi:hypothetical protein
VEYVRPTYTRNTPIGMPPALRVALRNDLLTIKAQGAARFLPINHTHHKPFFLLLFYFSPPGLDLYTSSLRKTAIHSRQVQHEELDRLGLLCRRRLRTTHYQLVWQQGNISISHNSPSRKRKRLPINLRNKLRDRRQAAILRRH